MKRLIACILVSFLVLALLPAALANDASLYFGSQQVTYRAETGAVLTVRSVSAPDRDVSFVLSDHRGNRYTAVLPKGKTEVQVAVTDGLPEDGSKTYFYLENGDSYVCRAPDVCAAVPRGAASFTFGSALYQTYAGREMTVKIRVDNGAALPAETPILICDGDGNILETISHNPNRQAYNVTFVTDDSWVPGRTLALWAGDRDTADDTTLAAVGYTGRKAIWGVERPDTKISFTMDCGSHNRYVMEILDILDRYGVKITFFVTGAFAAANPDMVREMARRGHEVGNHSWTHPDFDTLGRDEIYSELTRTNALLESITGQKVTVFRPPYGHCSSQTRTIVNALGMDAVRWTHESMDARNEASRENSLKYSTRNLTGGSIILTHTSAACTVAVLDQILQYYQDNGFQVVPVSQLLLQGDTWLDENGIQHAGQQQ